MKKENEEKQWYVIRTMSRQERKVAKRLEQIKLIVYLPLIKTLSQWSDRKKSVEKPLFSGYIFIQKTTKYIDTLHIPGVVNIIKHNRKIAIVKQSEIDTIKSIVKYGYDTTELPYNKHIELGTKVVVTQGKLKDLEGILIENNNEKEFIIYFESLGNCLKIKVSPKILKPIE
mgnify:CR=1 FL=1